MPRLALFLDRDGTLIRHVHYLHNPMEVELLPGITAALAQAKKLGYLLFLHTNQSGVGRGMFTLAQAEACNRRMIELIGLGENIFTDICTATEAPGQPQVYRKPSPKFAREMAAKHGLDLARCWMVGDYAADVETAFAAGMHAALIDDGAVDAAQIAAWRNSGREVMLYASLADLVKTLPSA
jgi:D-glycero-D-manno-heptose 1,7-bisphosphate phosphatase